MDCPVLRTVLASLSNQMVRIFAAKRQGAAGTSSPPHLKIKNAPLARCVIFFEMVVGDGPTEHILITA